MTGTGSQRGRDDQAVRSSAADRDRSYQFRTSSWWKGALKALGSPTRERVLAKLTQFQKEWAQDVPLNEIKSTFDYKQVFTDQACRKLNVYQIRPTGDTRVWVTVVEEFRTIYYLDVEHKTGKAGQNRAIKRCCDRALRIRSPRT